MVEFCNTGHVRVDVGDQVESDSILARTALATKAVVSQPHEVEFAAVTISPNNFECALAGFDRGDLET